MGPETGGLVDAEEVIGAIDSDPSDAASCTSVFGNTSVSFERPAVGTDSLVCPVLPVLLAEVLPA